jgi:hypothetical protein
MIMSLSGMCLSASLAIVIFVLREQVATTSSVSLIIVAAVSFLLAALFSIEASFFRNEYAITTQSQFISDLLKLLDREAYLVRKASIATLVGLGFLGAAIAAQAIQLL